jgi:hypothetical protein
VADVADNTWFRHKIVESENSSQIWGEKKEGNSKNGKSAVQRGGLAASGHTLTVACL